MSASEIPIRMPQKGIDVVEPGRDPRPERVAFDIGRDLRFSTAALESYAFARWEPVVHDLMVLAAAIEFSDRVVKRPPRGWARHISLQVPVHDPSLWNNHEVAGSLQDAVEFLTGDYWSITFIKRRKSAKGLSAELLNLTVPTEAILAYSDGMDSRAVGGLESARLGDKLVLVRVGTKTSDKPLPNGKRVPFTAVPYDVPTNMKHRETSARSRGFKFSVISGIAAYLTDASQILIPESGQGSIGPAILTVGHSYPDFRNHPLFARRMERFFAALLGKDIRYAFPRIWNTKGETLAAFALIDKDESWKGTKSCWRNNQWSSVDGKWRHCGVCAACMLRRVSVHAAGLTEPSDTYLCPDLTAPSLKASADPRFEKVNRAFEEYAIAGVLHMDHLADLSRADDRSQLRIHAATLGPAMELSSVDAEERLAALFKQHASEWGNYIDSLGSNSFIRQWAQARQ